MEYLRAPKAGDRAKTEGGRLEDVVARVLERAKYDVIRDPVWDTEHKVDLYVPREDGKDLAHPAEMQLTLDLDRVPKMWAYLNKPPLFANSVRFYVEVWTPQQFGEDSVAIIRRLLRRWQEPGAPKKTLYLRFGRDGRYRIDELKQHLVEVTEQLNPGHPQRRRGEIVGWNGQKAQVRTMTGETIEIPFRLMELETRYLFARYQEEGRLPPPEHRGISFLPGLPDDAGVPVVLAQLDTMALLQILAKEREEREQAEIANRPAIIRARIESLEHEIARYMKPSGFTGSKQHLRNLESELVLLRLQLPEAEREVQKREPPAPTAAEKTAKRTPEERLRNRLAHERWQIVDGMIPAVERSIARIRAHLASPAGRGALPRQQLRQQEDRLKALNARVAEIDAHLADNASAA